MSQQPASRGGISPLNVLEINDMLTTDADDKHKSFMDRSFITKVVQGTCIATAAIQCAAMAIEFSGIVLVAGLIAIVVSAAVFFYQLELVDTDCEYLSYDIYRHILSCPFVLSTSLHCFQSALAANQDTDHSSSHTVFLSFSMYILSALRQVQNELRRKVNEFATINNSLSNNVTRLEGQCTRLKGTEEELAQIADEQGKTVSQLTNIVQENRKIIDEKKQLIKADAMQALMAIILESEFDESASFNDQEIRRLMLRMNNLPAVTVQEDLLKARVEKQRSLYSVIGLLNDLDHAGDDSSSKPAEERIFTIHEGDYPLDRVL